MTCADPVTKLVQTFGDMLRRLRTEAALTQGELAKQTNKIHRTASVDVGYLTISDARNVLNLGKPVAVMFMGVLGYVAGFGNLWSVLARVMAAVPSGNYLVLWDGTDTSAAVIESGVKLVESGAIPYNLRSPEQIGQCFEAWRWWTLVWYRSRSGGWTPSRSARSSRLTPTAPSAVFGRLGHLPLMVNHSRRAV